MLLKSLARPVSSPCMGLLWLLRIKNIGQKRHPLWRHPPSVAPRLQGLLPPAPPLPVLGQGSGLRKGQAPGGRDELAAQSLSRVINLLRTFMCVGAKQHSNLFFYSFSKKS